MTDTQIASSGEAGIALKAGLWLAQIYVGGMFIFSGYLKLGMPLDELAKMGMVWPGEVSPAFLAFIGTVDLAGGLGLLLPALTRIQPRLTVWAAIGCSVLQVLAIAFHASRGEFAALPLNATLLLGALFIFWGRSKRAPILPR